MIKGQTHIQCDPLKVDFSSLVSEQSTEQSTELSTEPLGAGRALPDTVCHKMQLQEYCSGSGEETPILCESSEGNTL